MNESLLIFIIISIVCLIVVGIIIGSQSPSSLPKITATDTGLAASGNKNIFYGRQSALQAPTGSAAAPPSASDDS